MARLGKVVSLETLAAAAIIAASFAAAGDERRRGDAPTAEFHFNRLVYRDRHSAVFGGRFGNWTVDYPDAEHHFAAGVTRLTRVDIGPDSRFMGATDDALFDYPWLYAVEVGGWTLSDEEAARLREYLLRGGFMMVDDFHGSAEWLGFAETMRLVFPDRPIVDIADEDEVLHVLYDVDGRIQIPGVRALMMGSTYEEDGVTPTWRGIYDDDGRLMVAINHNMDLGDAWEHADDPWYPEPMTALAYRFAVNYVIYAMTH